MWDWQVGGGSLCVIATLVLLLLATTLCDTWGGLEAYVQTCPLVLLLLFCVAIAQSVPFEAFKVGLVKLVIRLCDVVLAECSRRSNTGQMRTITYSLLVGLMHGI